MSHRTLFNIAFVFFSLAGVFSFLQDGFPHGIQNIGLMYLALGLVIKET